LKVKTIRNEEKMHGPAAFASRFCLLGRISLINGKAKVTGKFSLGLRPLRRGLPGQGH
jgi:hypothetical protein